MAGIAPSTGFFPTLKRTACDRCRKSKLRCPPRAGDDEPCARCVRAGAVCFTGYTQPLGRTSGDRSGGQMQQQRQVQLWESPQSCSPPAAQALAKHKVVDTVTPPMDTSGPYEVLRVEDMWPTPPEEEEPETWNDIFGICLQASTEQEALAHAPHSTINSHQTDSYRFHDSNIPFQLQIAPSPLSPGNLNDIPQLVHHDRKPSLGHSIDRTLSATECDLRLSQLDADLCKQIRNCLEVAEQTHMESPRSPGAAQPCRATARTDANSDTSSNAVGKALCSTQQYRAILQSFVDNSLSSTGSGAHHPSFGDPQAPMSLACTLHLLLLYFHIVTLFDCLIVKLYHQLSNRTDDPPGAHSLASEIQSLPNLQFGGFQIQHRGFQTRILIQTVQHQFKLMENTLGLPPDLRVTEYNQADNTSKGLLAGDSTRSLLHVVLMQQSRGYGEGGAYGDDHEAALGSSASLRGNIAKLQSLADSDIMMA
ncbi:hypothetical protein F4677DRAFT_426815 [Hypoxylon crocopeplum]|nr:hypothetical protein F4677DRAFT_426815 [Hypoxylon crocopeplum]